jgi:hypothetical protein
MPENYVIKRHSKILNKRELPKCLYLKGFLSPIPTRSIEQSNFDHALRILKETAFLAPQNTNL